jgi:putative IMPACT (imprinted ancient) family translation regulator
MHPTRLESIITDRGSKYAVSTGTARSRAEALAFLKDLKRVKKYARATHNSWAVLLSDGTCLKGDDGESGAGMLILSMLQRRELHDTIIVVTRWYGGTKLGADRFRHVRNAVQYLFDHLSDERKSR